MNYLFSLEKSPVILPRTLPKPDLLWESLVIHKQRNLVKYNYMMEENDM